MQTRTKRTGGWWFLRVDIIPFAVNVVSPTLSFFFFFLVTFNCVLVGFWFDPSKEARRLGGVPPFLFVFSPNNPRVSRLAAVDVALGY